MGWIIRGLLLIAGLVASFFVARDALNFEIIQMVIAILLFTIFILVLAWWPQIKKWFTNKNP